MSLHGSSDRSENWVSEAEMSMDTFRRVVDSLESLPNLTRVIFTGVGEPLSHPNIPLCP